MIFFIWLAVLGIGVFATEHFKYVPLKVIRIRTVGNVTVATEEKRDIFEVISRNDYKFILDSKNLEAVNLHHLNGDTVLHHAVYRGSTESLRALLGKGVAVDMKDGKGRTPMWVAASKGNVESLKVLHEYGANINETRVKCKDEEKEMNRTLLHEAAIAGNDDAVSWLAGMKLDLEAGECDGWTPLHWAAYYGKTKSLEILLRNGANVNVQSNRFTTPLHWAAERGHQGTAFLAIQMGASLDPKDSDGWTPLHRAAQYGRLEMVQLLVDNGARVHSRTNDYFTPRMVAEYWGYSEVDKYLSNAQWIDDPSEKKRLNTNQAPQLKNCLYLTILLAIFMVSHEAYS